VARFLKHTACPVCGSSDALAHYSDGSTYCYSHGRSTKRANISPYVSVEEEKEQTVVLPSDITQNYSADAIAWCAKYEIGVEEMLRSNMYYSGARNQLIFAFLDGEGKTLAWQARNLNPVNKAKRYFTQGDVNSLLPIYHSTRVGHYEPKGLVLVEDCLSAIKCSEALERDAMPLLGSGITRLKLVRLRAFYDVLDVFLDPDMWPKSVLLAKQAEMLGFKVRSIKAEHDPKELTRENLCQLLK